MKHLMSTALVALMTTGGWAMAQESGADSTAAVGVDDEGQIASSRGYQMETAPEVFGYDQDGYLRDAEGMYLTDYEGRVIRINPDPETRLADRLAGADPTAAVGVDDERPITSSRGDDALRATDTVAD